MTSTNHLSEWVKKINDWRDKAETINDAISDEDKRAGALFELGMDAAKKILAKAGLTLVEDNPYEEIFSSYFTLIQAILNQISAQARFEEQWAKQIKASREIGPKTEEFLRDFRPKSKSAEVTKYERMIRDNYGYALSSQMFVETYRTSKEAGDRNFLPMMLLGWLRNDFNEKSMKQLFQAQIRISQLASGYDAFSDKLDKISSSTPAYAYFTRIRNDANRRRVDSFDDPTDADSAPEGVRYRFVDARASVEKVIDLWVEKLGEADRIIRQYSAEAVRLRSTGASTQKSFR